MAHTRRWISQLEESQALRRARGWQESVGTPIDPVALGQDIACGDCGYLLCSCAPRTPKREAPKDSIPPPLPEEMTKAPKTDEELSAQYKVWAEKAMAGARKVGNYLCDYEIDKVRIVSDRAAGEDEKALYVEALFTREGQPRSVFMHIDCVRREKHGTLGLFFSFLLARYPLTNETLSMAVVQARRISPKRQLLANVLAGAIAGLFPCPEKIEEAPLDKDFWSIDFGNNKVIMPSRKLPRSYGLDELAQQVPKMLGQTPEERLESMTCEHGEWKETCVLCP